MFCRAANEVMMMLQHGGDNVQACGDNVQASAPKRRMLAHSETRCEYTNYTHIHLGAKDIVC